MKKLLTKPSVALLIAVIVVIASILINTRVRFAPICEHVSEGFELGSGDDESSIASELKNLCEAAEKLTILAKQNEIASEDSEKLEKHILDLRQLLSSENKSVREMYSIYEMILRECFSLESALERLSLPETDAENLRLAKHDAAAAKAAIDNSSYNESVRLFQKRYKHFPTLQLAGLTGICMPELFS